MLDQDEGHAACAGQRVQNAPDGLEAARRRAYGDDREIVPLARAGGSIAKGRPWRVR
jgi:allantoicase